MNEKISVIIITKNEEENIETCIQSCKGFHDVLVLDSFSHDNTKAKALNAGARFFEQHWLGYGPQKNKAAVLAASDWVLSLDADEILSAALLKSLNKVRFDNGSVAYAVNRESYFLGKRVQFSGWQNDWVVRLYNRGACSFDTRAVHEKLTGFSKTIKLRGPLYHHPYQSKISIGRKIISYSSLGAEQLIRERRKQTSALAPTVWSFFKTLILKGGFLDGLTGFRIACMNARCTWEKYNKYKLLLDNQTLPK